MPQISMLLVNILGIFVFLAIGILLSKDRKSINWKSVVIIIILNLVLAWFFTSFEIGRNIVNGAAAGFKELVDIAYTGVAFVFADWVKSGVPTNFFASVLLPILMIVPIFDILTYFGILPFIIKWLGRGLSFITGQPEFESFFAVEMMFLGNSEALAVSKQQLNEVNKERNLSIAMMSMSCVTASIIGAYTQMMPGEFVLTAIPINILNAILCVNLLNPLKSSKAIEDADAKVPDVKGSEESAAVTDPESGSEQLAEASVTEGETIKAEREPFFSFLGDSILNSGKLILIIAANVIAFVALAAFIDKLLGLINHDLSLESILGVILFPFAWLTGLDVSESLKFASYMGTKLITNEFVVMGQAGPLLKNYSPHFVAALTVFVTSFANFSTIGIITGAFKILVDKEKNSYISKNIGYLLLSGILVSLLSAATVALFVW